MTTLLLVALAVGFQSADLQRIDSPDPDMRLHAIWIAGRERSATSVGRIIRRLQMSDEREDVKAEALTALTSITGRADLKDAAAWQAWWDAEGKKRYTEAPLSQAELLRQVEVLISESQNKLDIRVAESRRDIKFMAISMAVSIFIFLIVMIFFVGNVSSKIKGWRELVSRAEVYIKHSQELTERTDQITAELEAKKQEIADYVKKLREENEAAIARHGDILGADLEHRMRAELQTLRQAAEKELGQTLSELKTQLETAARRAAAEVRDRLAK